MAYIKSALETFTYTKAQWEHLVDRYEEELEEIKKALFERNTPGREYLAARNNYGPRLQA
jgi:sugar-specific transcriptional regulator TrmB